jgi:hypothetical protein
MRRFALLFVLVAACTEKAVDVTTSEQGQAFPHAGRWFERARALVAPPDVEPPQWSVPFAPAPYRCEEFEVHVDVDGAKRMKRVRREWTAADRRRFRDLVRLVAREMGANPRLFATWALRESTLDPAAIHVLDHDVEGATRAWHRHRWSAERARELEATMQRLGPRAPEHWAAKAQLQRISLYKDNAYYDDEVEFEVHLPTGEVVRDRRSRWAYGYGAFGFNPTYYVATWDADAPPWVFCDEDGIVATITAVWAARNALRDCKSLGFSGTYEVVNRRFASGGCAPAQRVDAAFSRRARSAGLDPEAAAALGSKWPRDTTDRAAIVAHMRRVAVAQGLLEPGGDESEPGR